MVPFFDGPYERGIIPQIEALAVALRRAGGVVSWVLPDDGKPTSARQEFYGPEVAVIVVADGSNEVHNAAPRTLYRSFGDVRAHPGDPRPGPGRPVTASAVCGPHRHGRPDRPGALRRQPDSRNYAPGQKISVASSPVPPEIGTSAARYRRTWSTTRA
ncbi:hypothetical protein [Kitasatospora sp. NPDC005751]|uniref:hypothetical protein n=1 Tax=Kitasatospora sp. NPDC005751 TaxID=3157064 RepID=UPI0033E689C5